MKLKKMAGFATALLGALALLTAGLAQADDKADAKKIVAESKATLNNFLSDPEMKWARKNLKKAKGVLIVPTYAKGGFIVAGAGGQGVLLSRDKKGRWAGPAFYYLGAASVGLQIGVDVAEEVRADPLLRRAAKRIFHRGRDPHDRRTPQVEHDVDGVLCQQAIPGLRLGTGALGMRPLPAELFPFDQVHLLVLAQVEGGGADDDGARRDRQDPRWWVVEPDLQKAEPGQDGHRRQSGENTDHPNQ